MSAKLTKAQVAMLRFIERKSELFAAGAHKERDRLREDVLVRLRNAGLIASKPPFASVFHSVTITDAGRAALSDGGAA